jgi:phage virion morphogenesis protein
MSSGVKLSWGGFDKAIDKAVKALAHEKRELMENVGEVLVGSVKKRFAQGKDPEGNQWKPVRRGGSPLVDTGSLRDSIEYAVAGGTVLVGSNKPQALIHQKGGTIKPKKGKYLKFKGLDGKDVFVKEVTIPARPYLGINDEDIAEVKGTIVDWLADTFKV